MPTDRWSSWAHVILGTRGSWLPGDPRGFRDHGHRIHSSGDYRCPPPPGEHAGLYRAALARCPEPLNLPEHLRPLIDKAFAAKCEAMGYPVRVLAVAARHAHALVRVGEIDAKPIVGRAKQAASHAVRGELPGSIWSQGCHVVRCRDESHYRAIVDYISRHAREDNTGAALWTHPHHQSIPDSR